METETFQHYQILRRADGSLWELGRGAMAVTYKAVDNNLRCPVALKVVSAVNLADEHTRARFVREARAAAALRHRNIASVYHLGEDGQSYFYAMEFVDGETVEDLVVRRGPLPPTEALGIAVQVARALGAAAKQGLVHRDIKPSNLMVLQEDDDEPPIVKVIDFGLARRGVVTDEATRITLSGFVGTPQYASPEQLEERDLDTRADIYSLGVTLWFMLTGHPTFTGPVARISAQHVSGEPPWEAVAHVPASVRALLGRMLQKRPADRPQDPAALRREIESCLAALGPGTPSVPATALGNAPTTAGGSTATSRTTPAADLAGSETSTPELPNATPQGPAPVAGEALSERFHLLESVGDGPTGQMFRAEDRRQGGQHVALRLLRTDPGPGELEFRRMQADFHRLRAAPHPQLAEVFAVDQDHGRRFVASEWINGFSLVDLLRHRGRLELREAFHLLAEASDAAAHGSANGLHRLRLATSQICVHFPAAFDGDKARAIRTILDRPLAQWPACGLKIEAITPTGTTGRPPTSVGAMTLVPAPLGPPRDAPDGSGEPGEGQYLYALGALLYETLNGTPPPSSPDQSREVPPLPMLGEQANEILRRALSATPDFRDERAFFDALLAASGLHQEDVRELRIVGARSMSSGSAADSTVVPSAAPALVAATSPAARMAPRLRTTPLQPSARTEQPLAGAHRRSMWRLLVVGLTILLVIVAITGSWLWSKRSTRVPPTSSPVQSPLPAVLEPDVATPASVDPNVASTPA